MKKFVRTRDFEVYAGIAPVGLTRHGEYFYSVRCFNGYKSQGGMVSTLRQAINLSIINFAMQVLKYNL